MSRLVWLPLACLFGSSPALAQPETPPKVSEADRLFEEGRTFAKDGKFVQACDRFTKSFEIDHGLGTELNLADCHEKLGHLRIAWRLFLAAADESERSDDTQRTAFARERAETLAARLTAVVVNVAQPTAMGLAISISGHTVEAAPVIRDRTEPGKIEVVATLPGRPRFVAIVEGQPNTTLTIDVPAFPAASTVDPLPIFDRNQRRVHLAWGIGAGGAASVVIGALVGLKARSDYNTAASGQGCTHVTGGIVCDAAGGQRIAEAQQLAGVGTGFAIVGVALVTTAVVVFVTAPRDRVVVAPIVAGDQLGIVARGSF